MTNSWDAPFTYDFGAWLSVAYNTALMGSSAYGAAESFSNGQAGLGAVAVVGLAMAAIGLGEAIQDYSDAVGARAAVAPNAVARGANGGTAVSDGGTCSTMCGGGEPPPYGPNPQVSERGLQMIAEFEGHRGEVYQDPAETQR